MRHARVLPGLTLLAVLGFMLAHCVAGEPVARYNVVWESPSKDASGQMPLGNGDIAAGVYAIEDGDLYLLLPAWPADWDADFKLHLTRGAFISGKVIDGKLTDWTIEPATRKKDVVVHQPQRTPQRPVVPDNEHPLRIGADQVGGNQFRGKIGRVTMFRDRLTPDTIRTLAEGDRKKKVTIDPVVGCVLEPKAGDVLPVKAEDLHGTVSFEAWILPEEREAGRILDKVTGGQGDGFLLDCWPNLSLRLIVGNRQKDLPGVLKPGVWQHVAVVIRKGKLDVYLNGDER